MARLTPEEDAAIQEEIKREMPQIDLAVDGITKHLKELSDVGKVYATVVIRALVDQRSDAVDLFQTQHMQSQVEGLLPGDEVRSQVTIRRPWASSAGSLWWNLSARA